MFVEQGVVVGGRRPVAAGIRDGAVDLARAWCLVVVVALHALMVGVTFGAAGPVMRDALQGWSGLPAFTWVAQIMPLFFVLGGFSAFTQWTRLNARGATATDYIALRMRRLMRPSVLAVGAMVLVLGVLTLVRVPGDIVAAAGFRLSQPLWFLGVYALTTACVPAMAAAHRKAPIVTLLALLGTATGVDVLRATTGVAAIGFVNLAFVWLLIQQLGFWLAQGRMPHRVLGLATLALCAYGALAVLCACGVYSFDLLDDLNPPCTALVLLGVGQLALFALMRPMLRRLYALRPVTAVGAWVNARAMTIYLWHMLVLILMAGALLLSGLWLPAPLTPSWWDSRVAWLLCVGLAIVVVVRAVARWETEAPKHAMTPGRRSAVVSLASPISAVLGVIILLVGRMTLAAAVVGLACLAVALLVASRNRGDVEASVERTTGVAPVAPMASPDATVGGSRAVGEGSHLMIRSPRSSSR